MTKRRQPERAIQQQGIKLLRSLGADVWSLGTTRRSGDYHGTMQTPGLPDVLAFLPMGIWRVLLAWEAKAAGGRVSMEQARFREMCRQSRTAHVTGDLEALIDWLVDHKFLSEANRRGGPPNVHTTG